MKLFALDVASLLMISAGLLKADPTAYMAASDDDFGTLEGER